MQAYRFQTTFHINMKKALISVIVPTYNRAELLKETIDSVFSQTWRPIELIIVDDGSTDNTEDTCNVLKRVYSKNNFKILYHKQKNAGVSVARNTGTNLAAGEFIQYLDSDDLLHPKKLETQAASLLANLECDVCVSGVIMSDSPEKVVWEKHIIEPKRINYKEYNFRTPAPTSTPLYRHTLIKKNPPWEINLNIGEDKIFILRAFIENENICHTPSPLLLVRQHDGPSLSSTLSEQLFVDRTQFYKIYLSVACNAAKEFKIQLIPFLIESLKSDIKHTITKGYIKATKKLIYTARQYPLTKDDKKTIEKLEHCIRIPKIFCRIAFRFRLI